VRIFEHFPERDAILCPLCGTNDDAPCFLVPIDGTDNDGTCEAQPTHLCCLERKAHLFRFNREAGIIYARTAKVKP
jgi:hypothetical protein